MNYINIAIRELDSFSKEFPEYSLSEILFSVLRLDSRVVKLSDILQIQDDELYDLITEAKIEEKDTPFTPEEREKYAD